MSWFDDSPTGSSIRPKICAVTCQWLTGQFLFISKPKEWLFAILSASSLWHSVLLELEVLWNHVNAAQVKFKLWVWRTSTVVFMQIVEMLLRHVPGTHLRQKSLWLKTLLCMTLFCVCEILFLICAPIYKVSVAALALISCRWRTRWNCWRFSSPCLWMEQTGCSKLVLLVERGYSEINLHIFAKYNTCRTGWWFNGATQLISYSGLSGSSFPLKVSAVKTASPFPPWVSPLIAVIPLEWIELHSLDAWPMRDQALKAAQTWL